MCLRIRSYSISPLLCFRRHVTMSFNESWVTEKITVFHNALLCRFREEAAIQASLRNLIKLEQTKNNNAQLELMALRSDKQTLSDKLFVK